MSTTTESLAEAYPKELQRVRDLLPQYESLGPVGLFGLHMHKQTIARAEKALSEGDTVAMIRSYKELQDCE